MTTWMGLEGIMLNEIGQTEKDKYCMVSLVCRTKKLKKIYKCIKTETDTENKLVVTIGE